MDAGQTEPGSEVIMGCSKPPGSACPYLHAGSTFTCPNYCPHFFIEGAYTFTLDQRTSLASYTNDELLAEIRRRMGT